MSWTKIAFLLSFCALLAAPVVAQPTIVLRDTSATASSRTFSVYAVPDPSIFTVDTNSDTVNDSSGVAIEVGLGIDGGISSANIMGAPVQTEQFEDDGSDPVGNPGYDPFDSGAVVEGFSSTATSVFAALGSTGLENATNDFLLDGPAVAFTFTVDEQTTVGTFSGWDEQASSLTDGKISQAGDVFFVGGNWGVFGDFNFDNQVEDSDFATFALEFGKVDQFANAADFNLDGEVEDSDFAAFALRFGLGTAGSIVASSAAVPEPTAIVLLGIGIASVVVYRRSVGN